ncbi:MAG: hypothetical protein IKF90_00200 [Parasporobacterium sp.]|nr:hypothetical protein [Parasporobacterium sp.]
MQILDNITTTVRDDLKETMQKGSKVSIATACFSIYAYKELKEQLEKVEEGHLREKSSYRVCLC